MDAQSEIGRFELWMVLDSKFLLVVTNYEDLKGTLRGSNFNPL